MHNFKPIPFYFINTTDPAALSREACRKAMQDLAENGYGGCVLFNKPPTGFDEKLYLTDYWFDTLENFIIPARELGLEIWINDGFDYPPGDAAGRIKAENPTLVQQRLRLNAQGVAEAVDTEWGFPAFELPESSDLFIKYVYEAHKERLGKYFGNGIYGFFSDCDNRRINSFTTRYLEDGRYYPWSKNFQAEFIQRRGYDITPYLTDILHDRAPEQSADYYQVAGELYRQWFANNHAWCQRNNLKYTFHTSDTGPLTAQFCRRTSLVSEGDAMELLFHSDFPGTDHEIGLLDSGIHYDARYRIAHKLWGTAGRGSYQDFGNTLYDVRAKYAASAAFMLEKKAGKNGSPDGPRTMCEMFAATNFGTDFQELRRIAMWQIMMGVNFIIPHAVHHRFYGSTKYFAPPEFLHGALRNGVKEFNELLAGACEIASRGKYLAEVAVIDPSENIWRHDRAASGKLLAICDLLNRSAVGYVVVTRKDAELYGRDFAMVIDPAEFTGALSLETLPGGDVSFSGGDLAYMRRWSESDGEFLIACNLWSDCELSGELNYAQKQYNIVLAPGEYAVLGGGKLESYRTAAIKKTVCTLPLTTQVEYLADQRIPLEVPAQKTVQGSESIYEFVWNNQTALTALTLEWSSQFKGRIYCDDCEIKAERQLNIFDDQYNAARLPEVASAMGIHKIKVCGEELSGTEPIYLSGDIAVTLWTDSAVTSRAVHATYNLIVDEPKRIVMDLETRKPELVCALPLAVQGNIFYDGAVVFKWDIDLAETAEYIDLGKTSGVCDIYLDGVKVQRSIVQSGALPLEIAAGKHKLEIKLYGSLGLLLEGGNGKIQLGQISLKK
ncbi:MAG: hypothetical protein E7056_02385 [Lentisphaerae bacterium]|nr:hypothetical protein [Lentisphaerota bacterium]